jgi:hypothetical protein
MKEGTDEMRSFRYKKNKSKNAIAENIISEKKSNFSQIYNNSGSAKKCEI